MTAVRFHVWLNIPVRILIPTDYFYRGKIINMVYLLTDDSYFALGIVSLLKLRNCVVTRIDAEDIGSFTYLSQDTLYLAMSDLSVTKVVLKEVTHLTLEVFVFLNIRPDFKVFRFPKRVVCTKRIQTSFLNSIDETWVNNFRTELTTSQLSVLNAFSLGMNPKQISKKLNISQKTISSHKMSGSRKMGLEGVNDILLMNIINLFKKDLIPSVIPTDISVVVNKNWPQFM
ncbi:hypothetical protein GE278_20280 [Enterobacteriaceae bacterium Kacie_13]|nr:hypothetical protein GE278_20280 [Enterobacteriaceae bacterium Kacie_13]